ncbi:MAG TPA: MFS transporter [Solirubrobacteraceae bacterium]|jgi:MFS family permease
MEAYARVLRVPHVPYLVASALVARLPYGIVGLSTLLFVHEEKDSFAAAGAVAAAFAIAAAVALPVLGRLIDVVGQTRVMLTTVVVQMAGGAALIALGLAGASTLALCVAAVVAGAAVTPVSPALRGLWGDLLGGDPVALRSALAVDAISLEFVFVGGPLLTALLVAVASPAAALAAGFALSGAGATAFAMSPASRAWRGSGTASFGLGPLTSPGLLTLLATAVPLGVAFGALEVGLPAFGISEGSSTIGALAVAALSLGSAAGGVVYGARPPTRTVRVFIIFATVLPLSLALLALPSSTLAMLLLAPVAGATLAPLTAVENELVGVVAPEGTVTEAYAWILTATVGGLALGTALGGAIIEASSWRETLLAGSAAGLAGAAVAVTRRKTLTA